MRDTLVTQRKIVESARVEFSSVGFDAARIDLIALRAGVSRQIIYQYYGSKEGLYLAMLDLQALEVEELFSHIDEQCPVFTALRQFIEAVFDYQCASGAKITIDTGLHEAVWLDKAWRIHTVTRNAHAKIDRVIERGKREGAIEPYVDSTNFYAMCASIATGYISCAPIFSKFFDRDYHSESAKSLWRENTVEMMLRSVRRIDGPPVSFSN